MPLTTEQIMAEVQAAPAGKVKVAVTDIDGVLRGKIVHRDKFIAACAGGFGFCNVIFGWDCHDVCYDNVSYTGWHTGYPDAQASVDLHTFRRVPWDDHLPFFLADFVDGTNQPLAVCPRAMLKRVLAKAAGMGFTPHFGLEFEWFNFRETPQSLRDKNFYNLQPLTPDMFGYSLLRAGLHREFVNAIFDDLGGFGVPLEGLHTETGPGVFEGAILVAPALEAADRGVLFKTAVKELAYRFGIVASFMAKWHPTLPGCGGHMHQSLQDAAGLNVFYDATAPDQMSEIFRHYLAGQLYCLPHILPLLLPNVNSYKRLVDGVWAPTKMTWGHDNRTTALRVISGSPKGTRLETRLGGADLNPYLAVAAALASGLYGIEHKLGAKTDAVTGSAYHTEGGEPLPRNLHDAVIKMQDSSVARQLFGAAFVDHFAATRLWEWRQYQQAVTNWELERYFEII